MKPLATAINLNLANSKNATLPSSSSDNNNKRISPKHTANQPLANTNENRLLTEKNEKRNREETIDNSQQKADGGLRYIEHSFLFFRGYFYIVQNFQLEDGIFVHF